MQIVFSNDEYLYLISVLSKNITLILETERNLL